MLYSHGRIPGQGLSGGYGGGVYLMIKLIGVSDGGVVKSVDC
jgi:hypothetical protein